MPLVLVCLRMVICRNCETDCCCCAGHWYPVGLKDKDFNGLFGYQVGPSDAAPYPLQYLAAPSSSFCCILSNTLPFLLPLSACQSMSLIAEKMFG